MGNIKVGDKVKFSQSALSLKFGKARSGYYRDFPEKRRLVVTKVRPRTYLVKPDDAKAEQEFAHEYIELAEDDNEKAQ